MLLYRMHSFLRCMLSNPHSLSFYFDVVFKRTGRCPFIAFFIRSRFILIWCNLLSFSYDFGVVFKIINVNFQICPASQLYYLGNSVYIFPSSVCYHASSSEAPCSSPSLRILPPKQKRQLCYHSSILLFLSLQNLSPN